MKLKTIMKDIYSHSVCLIIIMKPSEVTYYINLVYIKTTPLKTRFKHCNLVFRTIFRFKLHVLTYC